MDWSPERGEIVAALAKVAAEVEDPEKGRKVSAGQKQYRYASLGDALPDLRVILARHGCVVVQGIVAGDLVTEIAHTSGQWVRTLCPIRRSDDPQALGSSITYSRRYGLWSILGIASVDEDDDGAAATAAARGRQPNRAKEPTEAKAARQAEHAPDWEEGKARFFAGLATIGVTYDRLVQVCAAKGWERPSTLPEERRTRLLAYLRSPAGRAELGLPADGGA